MIKYFIIATAIMMTSVCAAEQTPAQPPAVVASNSSESWAARADAEMARCEAKLVEFERRLELLEGRM